MTTLRTILALAAGVAVVAGSATADSILLKRSIRRAAVDQPVRLGDIATIAGPHAETFVSLEIAGVADLPTDRVATIDIADVRARLDAAGVAWGLVDLSGGKVAIRPAISAASTTEPSPAPSTRTFETITPSRANTDAVPANGIHGFVRVSSLLDDANDDELTATIARLIFDDLDGIERHPERVLLRIDRSEAERLPDAVRDCRVRLRGRGDTDRVIVEVSGTLPEGRRPQVLMSVDVRLERPVPVATRRIPNGRRLLGAGVDLQVEWRPFAVSEVVGDSATLLDIASVIGRELAATVESGEPVLRTMLVPEIVVQRGMRVRVRSVFGGYEMVREMQALEDGAVGDRIMCGEPGTAIRAGRRAIGVASSDSIMAFVIDDRGTLEVR
jgi:flagella basal body P-ring formation protein FlgA